MKVGIILNTNKPETVWNAFRFGLTSLYDGHSVKVFLLGEGVEYNTKKDDKFDVGKTLKRYLEMKGELYACGTCLTIRQKEAEEYCPISTMNDMLTIIKESDKVLTFG